MDWIGVYVGVNMSGRGEARYKPLGKAGLGDKDWTEVNDANPSGMRFFKVIVELP